MASAALTTDSRSRPRYEVSLELQFSYRRGKCTYHGTGRTRDFNDKAICFESDQELPGGVPLELSIAWPVGLQGLVPLEMVVQGALVRRHPGLAVLHLDKFEFRTQGEGSFHERAAQGGLCNFLA
jgi:hypothetical protein